MSLYLCGCSKGMTKVNPDSSSRLQVNHEVGQVSIADTEYIVAYTEGGVGTDKVRTERQESFRG